jgi:hypothetical protein
MHLSFIVPNFCISSASNALDSVYIATDDSDIAACARSNGAGVVDIPLSITEDDSPVYEVLVQACMVTSTICYSARRIRSVLYLTLFRRSNVEGSAPRY